VVTLFTVLLNKAVEPFVLRNEWGLRTNYSLTDEGNKFRESII
jgi:hypothetical protein